MEIEIAVDGGSLVARRRPGAGVPLVLVHGSGGGLRSWDPVVGHLPKDVETWVYARRGYDPSSGCVQPKTYRAEVDDLAAVVEAAGGRAHVVGGSFGATVALHHAVAHPRAVASLSLFEPPLFAAGSRLLPELEKCRRLVAAGRLAEAVRLFGSKVARVPDELLGPVPPTPAADEPPADPAAVAGATANLHDLEAMAADDGDLSRWAAIGTPVLLMQGADTWSPMPETMEALAAQFPRATRVRWTGQSHFATFTAPHLVAAALSSMIGRTVAPPSGPETSHPPAPA